MSRRGYEEQVSIKPEIWVGTYLIRARTVEDAMWRVRVIMSVPGRKVTVKDAKWIKRYGTRKGMRYYEVHYQYIRG